MTAYSESMQVLHLILGTSMSQVFFCAHPKTNGLVKQMEFSSSSNVRGFSENLISVSEEFFEGIALSKVGSQ